MCQDWEACISVFEYDQLRSQSLYNPLQSYQRAQKSQAKPQS